MKVIVTDGKSFDIQFRRVRTRSSWGKPVIDTTCWISDIDLDPTKKGAEKYHKISEGIALQNSKDSFNRDRGRRIALGRAVKHLTDEVKESILDAYNHRS